MIKISRHISIIFLILYSLNKLTAQNIYIGTGDIHYECSGYFFDNGGENGYSEDDGVVTLCPNNTGNSIKIDFTNYSFLLAQGDVLKIYDGTSVSAPLIGEYTTVNNPGLVLPTIANTSGCLTFEFITDGNISPVPGWKASIDCQDCPDINFEINVSPSEIIPNGYRVEKGVPITFETDIENATYQWDFGDGFTASGQSVTHIYNPNPQGAQGSIFGTYEVKLIITTADGCIYSLLFNVQVTNYRVVVNDTYTVKELIEDVFVTGECGNVANIHSPSNGIVGGGWMSSLGYFERAFSDFTFEDGIVLTTGYLDYVPEGPNGGGGWGGDPDLDALVQMPGVTQDVTSIVFEFTPYVSEISFEYIFASYEYPQYICTFADTFAFILSGPGINNTNAYDHDANPNTPDVNLDLGGQNIALIPGTNIPVSATNVHHQVDCPGNNTLGEYYTDVYYDYSADGNGTSGIDFYGQTVQLTASAQVIPGETYTIKLAVGDYGDGRYQSAVFLKGESFTLGPDLGEDIVASNENIAILPCEGESILLNPFENVETISGLTYEWYKDGVLLPNETGETLEVFESGTYTVYVYFDEHCAGTDEIIVEFLPQPQLKENIKIESCDDGDEGNVFDLLEVKNGILIIGDIENFSFSFYNTEEDAENKENKIQDPGNYQSEGGIIWIRVENDEDCYAIVSIELVLHPRPAISAISIDEYLCLYSEDGSVTIDLTQYDVMINPGLPANTAVVYYADDIAYQNGDLIETPANYTTYGIPQTIVAQVIDTLTLCESVEIAEITLHTLTQPEVDISMYDGMVICRDSNPQTPVEGGNYDPITIETGLPADGNYSFNWTLNNQSIGGNSPSIEAAEPGLYEVEVTHITSGCVSNSNANLVQGNPPEFSASPLSTAFEENHAIEVYNINGSGDYEFKVGSGPWANLGDQERLVFEGIPAGEHLVYGRDKNGCGFTVHSILFIDYPKFFTPNEDGYNDYWSLANIHNNYSSIHIERVYIFDRYGKLLTAFPPQGRWDGTYNGRRMPSNDYWFRVEYIQTLSNGGQQVKVFKANFTLKR